MEQTDSWLTHGKMCSSCSDMFCCNICCSDKVVVDNYKLKPPVDTYTIIPLVLTLRITQTILKAGFN